MATTTTCVTCPTGRVANKEQSECVLANSWDHWGYDLTNRRWGYAETTLNLTNVASLKNKWSWNASGDVTATPTVYNGRLYFPDWNGKMWCLDATTGAQIWVKQILTDWLLDATKVDQTMLYPTNPKNTSIISRASPAIVPGTPNKLVRSMAAALCALRWPTACCRPLLHLGVPVIVHAPGEIVSLPSDKR